MMKALARIASVFGLAAASFWGGIAFEQAVAARNNPAPGHRRTDGSVAAGLSPETRKPFFTTPADAPGLYSWNSANSYCEALETGGHRDWRVPAKSELNELFNNRVAIGGFNASGSYDASWYWSSTLFAREAGLDGHPYLQRFHDGWTDFDNSGAREISLRCVR